MALLQLEEKRGLKNRARKAPNWVLTNRKSSDIIVRRRTIYVRIGNIRKQLEIKSD